MTTNKEKVYAILAAYPNASLYYYEGDDSGLSFYIEGDEIPEGVQIYIEDSFDIDEGYPIEDYL